MKKQEFLQGMKAGLPICLGYFSVSIAFGLTAVVAGMPVWSAVAISLFNLTSAGQFKGLNILIAQGSMVELALTTLIINSRYFLMSLSVSQKVYSGMKMWKRLAIAYGITDEIFAVSMQREKELNGTYMAGLFLMPILGWTSGTLFGAVAASYMPAALTSAMGIALYGMFIAIIVPPAREQRSILLTVLMAVAASLAFTYLPGLKNLTGGWSIILITLVVSGIAAWLFPIPVEDNEKAAVEADQSNERGEEMCQ